jgi:hypothetical protein
MAGVGGIGRIGRIGQPAIFTGVAYDPDAAALFARFTTPPTSARKVLIDNLVRSLKAGGVWSKLDAFFILAAADNQAARRNWIQDAYNLTAVSGPTFVADRGYTADGLTSYLDSGFNPTTAPSPKFALNSACVGAWVRTDVNEDKGECGNDNAFVRGRRGATLLPGYRANDTTTRNGNAIATSAGLTSWSRSGAAAITVYKDGAINATAVFASVALANANMRVCSSGTGLISTKQNVASFWGQSLSDAEQATIYSAISTYLTAVGA